MISTAFFGGNLFLEVVPLQLFSPALKGIVGCIHDVKGEFLSVFFWRGGVANSSLKAKLCLKGSFPHEEDFCPTW